jgi:hypothetical protein
MADTTGYWLFQNPDTGEEWEVEGTPENREGMIKKGFTPTR